MMLITVTAVSTGISLVKFPGIYFVGVSPFSWPVSSCVSQLSLSQRAGYWGNAESPLLLSNSLTHPLASAARWI